MSTYYLGIDVGKYHHQATLCSQDGKAVGKSLRFANDYSGFTHLEEHIEKQIDKHCNSFYIHAGMEASGPYWLSLYQHLSKTSCVTRITVLNPLQVKSHRNEDLRGNKTDKLDTLLIVRILRNGDFNPSSIPDEDDLALRHLTRLRADLVKIVAGLKKKFISIYDQVFPEYKDLFKKIFIIQKE